LRRLSRRSNIQIEGLFPAHPYTSEFVAANRAGIIFLDAIA